MGANQLAFIIVDPSRRLKQSEKELQISRVRSHAARGTHAYKRHGSLPTKHSKAFSQKTNGQTPTREIKHTLVPFRGNSDPFAAFALPINPEVNNILCFIQHVAIPNIYASVYYHRLQGDASEDPESPMLAKTALISHHAADRDWDDISSGLRDECYSYANLATFASMMAVVSPTCWSWTVSLAMRTKAVSLLRQRIEVSS